MQSLTGTNVNYTLQNYSEPIDRKAPQAHKTQLTIINEFRGGRGAQLLIASAKLI